VRDKDGLERALADIEKLKARAEKASIGGAGSTTGWHTALDLTSLLTVSEATARAALLRTESRGGHTRFDFPKSDPAQERTQLVSRRTAIT